MPLLDQQPLRATPDALDRQYSTAAENPAVEDESRVPFVAVSPVMTALRQRVELLAAINTPVLIVGESGTGKQTVARLIHQLSSRAQLKFVRLCTGVSGNVLERELFGDKATSRNDKLRSWRGNIELAHRGSLFISDIAELPLAMQSQLFHILRQRQIFRPGAAAPTSLDVRLLAGTSCDLKKSVEDGRLRQDLYYYLNAFVVQVPPLRERSQDIPELVKQFGERFATQYRIALREFSLSTLQAFQAYSWPGNLVELENLVKRYLIVGDEASLQRDLQQRSKDVDTRPTPVSPAQSAASSGLRSVVRSVRETTERDLIANALSETHWNRKAAARLLKISYRALLYKIADFHLVPPTEREHASDNSN